MSLYKGCSAFPLLNGNFRYYAFNVIVFFSFTNNVLSMQYNLAIDPLLNISASEFVAAWNSSGYAEQAEASVQSSPASLFLTPNMTEILLTAALSIPATVIATFITD
ncbi:MAG: hypothetical protein WCK32_10160, partial [Chlorobiaceae bacterium]